MDVTPRSVYAGTEINRLDPDIKKELYSYNESDLKQSENKIIDKLFNDFIDFDSLQEAVRQTHVQGFNTLEYIQKTAMDIRHVDIPIREFSRITKLPKESTQSLSTFRYVYFTDIDLVDGDKEYLFRSKTDLFDHDLSIQDISDNRNIFKNNIIPIINNKFYWNVRILVNDDTCGIIITVDHENSNYKTGLSLTEFNELIEQNATVSIYSIPNFYIETIKTTKATLGSDITSSNIKFNSNLFKKFTKLTPDSTLYFINDNKNNGLLSIVDSNYQDSYIEIPTSVMESSVPTYIVLTAIRFEKLDNIRVLNLKDGNEGWFILEDYQLPLPVNNIIPIIKTGNRFSIDLSTKIDLYYPNIYHISNTNSDTVHLLMFYDDTQYDSSYDNYIEVFYNYYDKILNLYKTTSLPDIVKDYRPVNIPMMNEFVFNEKSVYFPDQKNLFTVELFQRYVNKNPRLFLKYLYLKLNATDKYFIRVSKLDLTKRLRTTSLNDIGDVGDLLYFDKPRYVINLRKNFIGSVMADFKVYVDGVALDNTQVSYTYNKDHFLIYIDKDIIKPTSMIEIEKYPNQLKRIDNIGEIKLVSDTTNDLIEQFPDIIKTVPLRIDFCDQSLKKYDIYNVSFIVEKKYIPKNKIHIFVYNDILKKYIEINKDGHYCVDRSIYVSVDESYIGKSIACIYETSLVTSQKYVNVDNDNIVETTFSTMRETHMNDIRVFRNGLLMPQQVVSYEIHNNQFSYINMYMNAEAYDTGYMMCDAYPIEFCIEYSAKQIDNDKGLVDTGTSLTYPLDFKWYDIYLNGVKLNKDHVEIISSSKFIVKNVDSLKNLYVIKRNWINDAFSMDHNQDAMNIYTDNVKKFVDLLIEDKDIIQDTAEDIIRDVENNVFEHISFVKSFLEFRNINPNIKQLSPNIKAIYPKLFDEHNILILKTSELHDASYVTSIDSNMRRDYMKNDQYRYSFTPLYVGNHSDALNGEYMCDPVTGLPAIKMESGEVFSSGLFTRLTNHKDRLNTRLVDNSLTSVAIYQLDRNQNTMALNLNVDENVLDEIVDLNAGMKKMMLSFDMDILEKGTDDVLMMSEYDPTVEMVYSITDDSENISIKKKLSEFNESPVDVNTTDMTIKSIKILSDESAPNGVKFILYSLLIAF